MATLDEIISLNAAEVETVSVVSQYDAHQCLTFWPDNGLGLETSVFESFLR